MSIGFVSLLTACGGGGGGKANEAALGTAIVVNKGDSSVANQTYTLDTTHPGVSAAFSKSVGEVELVFPKTDAFELGLIYVRGHADKYIIGFWDNGGENNFYSCRSNGWTNLELQQLAADVDVQSITTLAVCRKVAQLESGARRVRFSDLKLPSADGGDGALTLSAHFTWPAPEASDD